MTSTVDAAVAHARTRGVDRLDAQLLVAHVTGHGRAWQLAHGEATLAAEQADRLRALVERRARGEPLAYLVGEKEFHGLMLRVDARVLVPRPDTEVLVDWALERLRDRTEARPAVVDLGTGSGAIALALKAACPSADLLATDLSADALTVAGDNARRHGLEVRFAEGRWWDAVAGLHFALAVSNPPYIAGADPHLDALRDEPQSALTPGVTGLEALGEIVASAPRHLLPGAWLLLEHGHDQAEAVRALLARSGFAAIESRSDLAGLPRCTGGQR